MFAKIICVLSAVAFAAARAPGVDPNTLSCDPLGQVFLLLPHYTDCTKYFVCDHGQEVEMPCAPGTIFDFPRQTCNYEWATTCQLRDRDDDIEGSGDEDENDGSGYGSGLSSSHASSDRTGQVEELRNAVVTAGLMDCDRPESSARQMSYSGDCQRYWRCSGRTLEAVYCADGLFFNPESRQCDFEANVKCGTPVADELAGEFIVYK